MLEAINNNPEALAEFFSFNAEYLIAPGAEAEALMNDASCLMAAAISILLQSSLDDSQHGALHLMNQAKAALDEANSKLMRQGAFK